MENSKLIINFTHSQTKGKCRKKGSCSMNDEKQDRDDKMSIIT